MTSGSGGAAEPPELIERALAAASLPCLVHVTEHSQANLRWAGNALTTNGEMRSTEITVVATAAREDGTAAGTVSRQISDVADVGAIVAAAEQAARTAPASPDAAPLVEDYPHDDVWDAPPEHTGIEVLTGTAADLGRAFGEAETAGHRLYGFAEHLLSTTYLGSSTGLRRRGVQPSGRLELNARSTDGAGSAWVGAATRSFTDVDVSALHAELVTRLGWAQTTVEMPPGRYETLLPPGAVADLMIYAMWTASARDAEEGRNVYAAPGGQTKIGARLTEVPLTMRSDPTHPGLESIGFVDYLGSTDGTSWSFDGGLPLTRVDWIKEGRLNELIRNRGWASRTSQAVTAPADNLIMDGGGTTTLEEMIAATERGLLLTCLWYIREVDPERLLLTGLTRDGVYLVEDGRVVAAVNNFRWNESPIELLGRVTEVGASQRVLCREWNDWVTRTEMPPLRVPDFNMSTVSQAS